MIRTHDAGALRLDDAGEIVTLAGWVARRRDHGGVAFIDLRDASGVVQVVVREDELAHDLRNEWCVAVTGEVRPRPEGNVNPSLPSGAVEVAASRLDVLSESAPSRAGGGNPAAQRGQPCGPRCPLRERIRRDRDADTDLINARGRA